MTVDDFETACTKECVNGDGNNDMTAEFSYCYSGFTGESCVTSTDIDIEHVCSLECDHGTCVHLDAFDFCDCEGGYAGKLYANGVAERKRSLRKSDNVARSASRKSKQADSVT